MPIHLYPQPFCMLTFFSKLLIKFCLPSATKISIKILGKVMYWPHTINSYTLNTVQRSLSYCRTCITSLIVALLFVDCSYFQNEHKFCTPSVPLLFLNYPDFFFIKCFASFCSCIAILYDIKEQFSILWQTVLCSLPDLAHSLHNYLPIDTNPAHPSTQDRPNPPILTQHRPSSHQ